MAGATNGCSRRPTDPGAYGGGMTLPYETQPYETQRPIVSDDNLAIVVYALYGLGYFTGISALMGLIIAYVKADDADPMLRSHYRFQIRTFWIGLLYLAIGTPLTTIIVGFLILLWWFIWSLVRN